MRKQTSTRKLGDVLHKVTQCVGMQHTNLSSFVMASIIRFLTLAGLFVGSLSITLFAQTSTVIPDEAAQHVGQHVTVEGVVVKVFTSKNGNTFLNFSAAYPDQTFTGWIPAGTPLATDASIPTLQGCSFIQNIS